MIQREKYEMRTEEADEVLLPISKWVSRWGFTVLLICLGLLVAAASMITVADMVYLNGRISCNGRQQDGYVRVSAPVSQDEAFRIANKNRVLVQVPGYPEATFGYMEAYVDSVVYTHTASGGAIFTLQARLPSNGITTKYKYINCACGLAVRLKVIIQTQTILAKITG